MLIKKITYKDFNGVERTEDFMFHLMESEIAEMELSTAGGFAESLEKIVQTQNVPEIIKEFKRKASLERKIARHETANNKIFIKKLWKKLSLSDMGRYSSRAKIAIILKVCL